MNCGQRQHTANVCGRPANPSTVVVAAMAALSPPEEHARQLFEPYGEILDVTINGRKPAATHAFVFFNGKKMDKHAQKACKKVSKKELMGHTLKVEPATSISRTSEPRAVVFCGNLPLGVTEEQLRPLFKKYKTLDEIRIHNAMVSVEVQFSASEMAKYACLMLHGTVFQSSPLSVELKRLEEYTPKQLVLLTQARPAQGADRKS
eukprot:RCo011813